MTLTVEEFRQRVEYARLHKRSPEIAALNEKPLKQERAEPKRAEPKRMDSRTAALNHVAEHAHGLAGRILIWFGDAETGEYHGIAEYDPH